MNRGKHFVEDLKRVLEALKLEFSLIQKEEQTQVYINQQHCLSVTDHFLLFFRSAFDPVFFSGKKGFLFASQNLSNIRLLDLDDVFFDELEPLVLSVLDSQNSDKQRL